MLLNPTSQMKILLLNYKFVTYRELPVNTNINQKFKVTPKLFSYTLGYISWI